MTTRTTLLLVLVAAVLAAAPARAASPALGSILPRGVTRGTEAVLTFGGDRLADAKEVMLYDPGVTVTKLEVVNTNQVKAAVKVAPDCPIGEHAVRLRTASGVSELLTFYVGALPTLDEKEPNSDFAAPQKIALNTTVHGTVEAEDVDYFAFEGKKGQRVSVEVEAMRLGALFDPYVAILDARRFELAAADDMPLLGQDACCSVVLPADGTYTVLVRESAYGGNGACRYRLHVGTFPRPTAVYPAGGPAGTPLEVRFLGDPAGEFKQQVTLPTAVPTGKFGLFAQDSGGIAPSAIPFRVSPFPNVLETEGNNTHATATPVAALPAALNGVISKDKEVDHFRLALKKGQVFDVHCYARRLGSPLDPVMTVAALNGGVLAANDDAVGPDSYFRFTAPADGDYVLTVTDHLGKGGPTYVYRVELTPPAPKLSLTVPKVDIFGYSQERQTISVPRGNRYATLINASRADFGGDLILSAEGLPAGVTMTCEPMPAGLGSIPVLFEAKPDAPVAGALAKINGRHADPKQAIAGGFEQAVMLVAVGNQGVFWRKDVDRAAVAVTDEVPFKVSIVEPKVPLVQNGSMSLKIVAERQAGFKGPITIVPLFNPPGVSTAASATIAEGQNETVLPVNAAPNAQPGKWKTAVQATANIPSGPVWVSSQLATVEVSPPFVSFAMERAAGEQGKATELFCKIAQSKPFEGAARVVLVGLPPKVTTGELQITKDSKEVAFKLALDPASPAGQHNNIFCQVFVPVNGEPVLHNTGGTQLRIDVPIAKPAAPAKPAVAAAPTSAPPAAAPAKRLTRLEQLRLEQAEREKAGGQSVPAKPADKPADKPPEKK